LRKIRNNLNMILDQAAYSLVRFTMSNVRSFRDDASLSLEATRMADRDVVRAVQWRADGGTVDVLPVAGIFGANASGKTSLLRAMADMRMLVLGSFRHAGPDARLPRRPFRLDPASVELPSRFEVDVVVGGVRWQYGFDVTDTEVVAEYAYRFPRGRQVLVFERDHAAFEFGAPLRQVGRTLERITRAHTLLLSVAGAAGDLTLAPLFEWFAANLRFAEVSSRGLRAARTAELAETDSHRNRVLAMLRAADLGVTDIRRESADPEFVENMRRAVRILNGVEGEPDGSDAEQFVVEDFVRLTHCGPDGCTDLDPEDESLGTLVWVGLIGPVLDALDAGSVLLADELDASLHPRLVEQLVRLFQDPVTNPHGAQLIFNAHNLVLLGDSGERPMGRDQVWITEKMDDGASRLYPITEFSPRSDEALGRRYLQGRYGGLPIIDPAGMERAALGDRIAV
jgi:uncharacterized protein